METKPSCSKRPASSTKNLKQIQVNNLKQIRKEQRELQHRNWRNSTSRNVNLQNESPNTTPVNNIPDNNTEPVMMPKDDNKKNLNKALVKWQQEKKKQKEDANKKLKKKPQFIVSAHYQSAPASALPAVVMNSTYKNVSPRVSTRKLNSTSLVMAVPAKFSFRRRCKTPAIFEFVAAPVTPYY